jgi:two-component system sensor histidine kinase YesM
VGKMLYGLAVVFRSQIKDSNIINLAKEIYYCKKYLEIFEFRYQDNFRYELDCPDEYALIPVIKFIIQPIIENYFAHGIRLEDNDNCLILQVSEAEGDLIIQIKDNGRGMTQEQIDNKLKELDEKSTPEGSMGVLNVHRRMIAAYGNAYGVFLEQNLPRGLCVTLKLPIKEENNV